MIFRIADFIADHTPAAKLTRIYQHTPTSFLRSLSLYHFRKTVQWAGEHSVFYRRAFQEHGINPHRIRKPEDLGDFYTMPDDIVRNPTEFLCAPPNIVFESSGTSGKNKQIYYSKRELHDIGTVTAGGMQLMGVTPEDRIANAFDFSIWIPGMIFHEGLMAAGNFCQAFGKVDPIEVYRRLEQYKFTVVLGEPTWLIRLTELAEKHGRYKLKMLIGGAEEMPADAIAWMAEVWGGAKVKMCYGSVELGSGLGFQPCDNTDGYHVDNLSYLPEIMEPDGEGYGELVFTTLRRRVMPLIRYRTRDITRLEPATCPCGLESPRMARLRGRRDEMIVASGGNLYPLMFEHILKDVRGLSHDWQVVFRLDGVREVMEIHVETLREDVAEVRTDIEASATHLYPDLMKNLALGIFRMEVLTHTPGTLRVARKLRRMVDRRHYAPRVADAVAENKELAATSL